jgi:hypothetical protein
MSTIAFFQFLGLWWHNLDTPAQIFTGIGIAAGIATVCLLVLTIFGLDHGDIASAAEVNLDAGDASDGSLFSIRSVTAFFLGFGGGGSVIYGKTGSVLQACGGGVLIGCAAFYVIYLIGKKLMRLQSDGTIDYRAAVGATGTVYVTIPPKRGPGGQAQVTFSHRCEIINAVTDHETAVPAGRNIRVKTHLANDLFLIEPL